MPITIGWMILPTISVIAKEERLKQSPTTPVNPILVGGTNLILISYKSYKYEFPTFVFIRVYPCPSVVKEFNKIKNG